MPLQKIQFRPGIVRDLTAYTTEGGWYDGNLVRFRFGFPQSVGGWQRLSNSTYLGTCRSLLGWSTLGGQYYVGVGTNLKFYVERGGSYYDVTPIRRTVTLTAWSSTQPTGGPFVATNGSPIINVYDVGHGAVVNDFVTFSGATGLGGNITDVILNKEYQITKVIDLNNYQITASVNANPSDTGHGVTVTAAYQINTGLDVQVNGAGWGSGTWSSGSWGSGSVLTASNGLRLWSQDTWGENIFFNVQNGGIYYWVSSSGLTNNRAVALSSLTSDSLAPTQATQVFISDRDRHLVALAPNSGGSTAQDAMLIRWCNQEDYTTWTPTVTNTAGDLRLGTGSHIVRGVETKRETLIFTDTAVYSMQYIGPPYTFGIQQVSTNTTTSGYNAFAVVEDVVYWMGQNKFYIYTGASDELPCPVKNYVFENINQDQLDKVTAAVNSEFNEITWFYPSLSSLENDRYVTYNYAEKAWTYGILARTAWLDRGVLQYPLAAAPDHYLYYHEIGVDDGSTGTPVALNAYIESSPFDIGDGDKFSFIKRIIPDLTFVNSTSTSPTATMTLKMQNFPGSNYSQSKSPTVTQSATIPVEQFTEQMFLRLRGRQATFRVGTNQVGTRWILGSPRIEIQPDGRR
jgi:hypothetical protein